MDYSIRGNIFSNLHTIVSSTLTKAQNEDITWFQSTETRRELYNVFHSQTFSVTSVSSHLLTVQNIWKRCCCTAPFALTIIASEESYKDKKEAILFTATANGVFIDLEVDKHPTVKKGLKVFKEILENPLKNGEGIACLCNLCSGNHVFVVEKRSNDECTIYQSYLNNYTFDQFLSDNNKHKNWKIGDLIEILTKVILPLYSDEERKQSYQELFFGSLSDSDLKKMDLWVVNPLHRNPFLFVDSSPYALK